MEILDLIYFIGMLIYKGYLVEWEDRFKLGFVIFYYILYYLFLG